MACTGHKATNVQPQKLTGAEREREVAERGAERGAGVTEMGLGDERQFCRSRSAHMLRPVHVHGCVH